MYSDLPSFSVWSISNSVMKVSKPKLVRAILRLYMLPLKG